MHTIFFGSQICEGASMKARSFQSLILAWSVLACGGCHCDCPACSQPLAAAEPCSLFRQPLVFYDETGTPSDKTPALSELELSANHRRSSGSDKGPDLAHPRQTIAPGGSHDAGIVLSPHEADVKDPRQAARTPSRSGKTRWYRCIHPGKYVQISKQGQTFTQQLTLPPVGDLPFSPPGPR